MIYEIISYYNLHEFTNMLGEYQGKGWTVHTFISQFDPAATKLGEMKYTALLERKEGDVKDV